jgi:hypothetical protein
MLNKMLFPAYRVGTESGCLDSVVASTVFDLDATIALSYSGIGQKWANLTVAPADGSAQAAYDFFTGDGSTSTTYPTFNGTAGSPSAYWSLDGGDYFKLKSGANTAFLKNLHKTTGGQNFWAVITGNYATTANRVFWSTQSGSTGVGCRLRGVSSSEDIQYTQRGSANVNQSIGSGAVTADFLFLVSYDHATTTLRYWKNTLTSSSAVITPSPTTTDASGIFHIGQIGDGTSFLPSGSKIYSFAMGNEYLNDTKAGAIIAALESRHGRDYA